ncbi:MAG: hypothetical protein ACRCZP_11640 [Phycicoccus sp.]
MKVRTDDAARRLEFPLLGPTNMRFPVTTTLPIWGGWFTIWTVLTTAAWALTPSIGWFLLVGIIPTGWVAARIMARVRPHIDRVTPLMYWLRTARAEIETPRVPPDAVTEHVTTITRDIFTPTPQRTRR